MGPWLRLMGTVPAVAGSSAGIAFCVRLWGLDWLIYGLVGLVETPMKKGPAGPFFDDGERRL